MTNQELRQFGYKAIAEYNALAMKVLSKDWYKKHEDAGLPHGVALSLPDTSVMFLPGTSVPTDLPPLWVASALITAEAEAIGFVKLSSSPQLDDPETRAQVFQDHPELRHRSELARKAAMSDARREYKEREAPRRIFAMFASSYECYVFTAEYDEEFGQFVNTQIIEEELLYPGEKNWVEYLLDITGGLDSLKAKLESRVDTSEESLEEQLVTGKAKLKEGDRLFREAFNITEEEFERRGERKGSGNISVHTLRAAHMPRGTFMDESRTHLFS